MADLPNYAVPTGEFIAEWLEDNGLRAAELARRLSVSPKHVSELISGKAPLSQKVAIGLERVTKIPARIWNAYERQYREDLARIDDAQELASQYSAARNFPLAYLRKWGYLKSPSRDKAGVVRELLDLFGIASLTAFEATWVRSRVAYRNKATANLDEFGLATWFALGEQYLATQGSRTTFDEVRLKSLLPELRSLTRHDDPLASIELLRSKLASVGVILFLSPPIPGLGVYGATRWVQGTPLIQLSLLQKSDDQFWFTVFHELAHVLLHSDDGVLLAGKQIDSLQEDEANEFASEFLIPPAHRKKLPTRRDIGMVKALAQEIGVAPSIVLGQCQRITGDYAWGHQLKVKFEWSPNT